MLQGCKKQQVIPFPTLIVKMSRILLRQLNITEKRTVSLLNFNSKRALTLPARINMSANRRLTQTKNLLAPVKKVKQDKQVNHTTHYSLTHTHTRTLFFFIDVYCFHQRFWLRSCSST